MRRLALLIAPCLLLMGVPASGADRALFDAIRAQDVARVRQLLEDGADPKAPNERGLTPLGAAAETGNQELIRILKAATESNPLLAAASSGDRERVAQLLAGGADPDATNERGATALSYAVQANDVAMMQTLIDAGADVNRSGYLSSALNIDADRTEAAIALIEAGADVESAGHSGRGPLQAACSSGNLRVASLLIEKGADVNASGGMTGMTPLHYAAARNSVALIELLLAHDADVNARSGSGNTALHYGGSALAPGDPAVARLLIRNGADVHAANEKGQSPVEYARTNHNLGYAEEIEKLAGGGE